MGRSGIDGRRVDIAEWLVTISCSSSVCPGPAPTSTTVVRRVPVRRTDRPRSARPGHLGGARARGAEACRSRPGRHRRPDRRPVRRQSVLRRGDRQDAPRQRRDHRCRRRCRCRRSVLEACPLDPSDVPTTISGVLQARLDQLGADERTVLQHAAVMGRTFWDDAVASMMARPMPPCVRRRRSNASWCPRRAFVVRRLPGVRVQARVAPRRRLRDRPAPRRAALHAQAAAWLTERAGDRVDEYLDTIADHHRRGAEHDERRDGCSVLPRRRSNAASSRSPSTSCATPWSEWELAACPCRSRHSSCSARCSAAGAMPTRPSGRCAPRSTASGRRPSRAASRSAVPAGRGRLRPCLGGRRDRAPPGGRADW